MEEADKTANLKVMAARAFHECAGVWQEKKVIKARAMNKKWEKALEGKSKKNQDLEKANKYVHNFKTHLAAPRKQLAKKIKREKARGKAEIFEELKELD